jgi:hypothetical protein
MMLLSTKKVLCGRFSVEDLPQSVGDLTPEPLHLHPIHACPRRIGACARVGDVYNGHQ